MTHPFGPPPAGIAGGAAKPRRAKPAVLALVAGLALIVPAVATIVPAIVRMVASPSVPVPGTVRRSLEAGEYAVYEHTGTGSSVGPMSVTRSHGLFITAADVHVEGPAGPVGVRDIGGSTTQTIRRNNDTYTAAVVFVAERPGAYTVTVSGLPTDVIVARTFTSVFRRAVPALLAAVAGGALVLTSIVLFIVLVARRPKQASPFASGAAGFGQPAGFTAPGAFASVAPMNAPSQVAPSPVASSPVTPSPVAPAAAPGWYPDVQRTGFHRYWDGSQWTEHRS